MNLLPSNLLPSNPAARRKQLIFLGALVVVLVGVLIFNREPSAPTPPPVVLNPAPGRPVPGPVVPVASEKPAAARKQDRRVEDFRPTLKMKEGTDVSRIDPTLRLDLLAKLQSAAMQGGARSVFAFGAAPVPKVDPIQVGLLTTNGRGPAMGPALPKEPPKPAGPPPKPPPPPIPLKFYGFSNSGRGGAKRAFFLDGDDIQVAGENETIRDRYKVIRIGVSSVVVEDTQNKNQQTLQLVDEMAG